ncbi:MAG: thiamine phosphate synthase [Candidatus Omnitrophota bacterium]
MNWKKQQLKNSRLYLILDNPTCGFKNLSKILTKAIKGGVDIVQLRDKTSSAKTLLQAGLILKKIAKKYRRPFIVNDRLDIAIALDADGVHLGQEDVPVSVARKILGSEKIIGLSTHSLKEVKAAQKMPIDYLGFGPVFQTATKPTLLPKGIKMLKNALTISKLPIFAIGGIEEKTLSDIMARNIPINRAAVCRPVCLARNPEKAARRLKDRLKNV